MNQLTGVMSRPDVRLEHIGADGVLQLIRENDLLHARVEELTGQLTRAETQGEQTTRELYRSLLAITASCLTLEAESSAKRSSSVSVARMRFSSEL